MNASQRLMPLFISLACIAALACGGAGGGSASGGIGGSGVQARSVGSVSAIGSITVNGVKFQTGTAAVTDDDGQTFPESNLAEGMVVEVDGRINADGVNGTAAQVTVVTAVQGHVDQAPATAGNITVLGQPVAIDDQTVVDDAIEILGGISALTTAHDVEVHGTVDPNGTIRATRIELKTFISVFKVRGFIDGTPPGGTSFTINGLTVNHNGVPLSNFGIGGPAVGDFVSVKGNDVTSVPRTLTATSVENEARSLGENQNAEIEGFITSAADPDFTIVTGAGTFQFRVDPATEFEGGDREDMVVGLKVEVDGAFSGGVLFADKVEVKDGIRIETNIDAASKNIANLTFSPAFMSAIVLKINDQTDIDDRRGGVFPLDPTPLELLNSLDGSETLRLRARVSSAVIPNATELVVTELRISNNLPSVIDLRGPLDGSPDLDGDLQILGVTIISFEPGTTFFDIDDVTELSRTAFLNQVTTGTLVKAEGTLTTNNQMDATQLSIED